MTINSIVKQVNTSGLMAWISNSDYRSENERASTQLTALLFKWGVEWTRENKVAVPW